MTQQRRESEHRSPQILALSSAQVPSLDHTGRVGSQAILQPFGQPQPWLGEDTRTLIRYLASLHLFNPNNDCMK